MAEAPGRETDDVRLDVNSAAPSAVATEATLSRTLARKLRDEARVHECVAGTQQRRLLRLLSGPRAIWRASSVLGCYFGVLLFFMGLSAVLSLVSIYPVVAASQQSSSDGDSYRLLLDGREGGNCSKAWRSTDFVTDISAGAFCASGHSSSALACPATCAFNSNRTDRPQCRGVQSVSGSACARHLPCSSGKGVRPQDPDGPCLCCHLQVDSSDSRKAQQAGSSAAQALPWLVVVGGVLLQALLWWLPAAWALRLCGHDSSTANSKLGSAGCTAATSMRWSDYTVLLKWDPRSVVTPDELAKWATQYGEVAAAMNIPSAGETLHMAQQLEQLRVKTAEQGEHHAFPIPPRWRCLLPLYWCHWAVLGRQSPARQALHDAEARLAELQAEPLKPTGKALISFAVPSGAMMCVAAAEPTLGRRAANLLLRRRAASSQLLKGEPVLVSRAPEPADIRWEHIQQRGWRRFLRLLPAAAAALAVCGVSLGFQLGFAAAATRHTSTGLRFSFAGGAVQSSARPAVATTLAIVSAVFVVAFNGIIGWAVTQAGRAERWTTKSGCDGYKTGLLAVMWTLNTFLLPLSCGLMLDRSAWYLRGGVAERAFWLQVANAGLPPVLRLAAPGRFACRFVFARYVHTQDRMNQLLTEPPFPLARRLAAAVTLVALGVLWFPTLPVSPMLALAGLALQYAADQVEALRRAPPPLAPLLGGRDAVSTILQVLPALQLVLTWRVLLLGFDSATPAFWAGAACWGLFTAAAALHWVRRGLGRLGGGGAAAGARLDRALQFGGGPAAHYMPHAPSTCSEAFKTQLERAFTLPPALSAAVAASSRGSAAHIAVRAGSPVSTPPRTGGSLRGGTAGGRYDPHTPPLVPRAGSLRGGGADASDGARLVSTSIFTPSLGQPDHEELPGNMSGGTPSAPMLPAGVASTRTAGTDLPAALPDRWHGDAADSYADAHMDGMDSPLPAWRRNTAYEGSGGGSPFAAAAAAQHPRQHGSPQRRLFGGSGGDESRPSSHPLAFGSYVQPADGGDVREPLPPSRPSAWPDAAPDSSPFRPRQVVRFAEPAGEHGSSAREPASWQPPPPLLPAARPPLAVNTAPALTDSSGQPIDDGASDGSGGGGHAGEAPGYAPPPAPVVTAATPRARQPSYLRAHLQAAALLAAQRQEREEQRQRARRSPA